MLIFSSLPVLTVTVSAETEDDYHSGTASSSDTASTDFDVVEPGGNESGGSAGSNGVCADNMWGSSNGQEAKIASNAFERCNSTLKLIAKDNSHVETYAVRFGFDFFAK